MGLEIKGPYYLHGPKNPHSSTRIYSHDYQDVLTQYVHKTIYGIPPHWFRTEWITTKPNVLVARAAIGMFLRLHRRFGFPQDPEAVELARSIRDAAMTIARQVPSGKTKDSLLGTLEKDQQGIEPLAVTRIKSSEKTQRTTFCYPTLKITRTENLARISEDLTKFVGQLGVTEIDITSLYGTVKIAGDVQEQARKVIFSSRYRIARPATMFFIASSGIKLNGEEIAMINDHLREPIFSMPNPREAK